MTKRISVNTTLCTADADFIRSLMGRHDTPMDGLRAALAEARAAATLREDLANLAAKYDRLVNAYLATVKHLDTFAVAYNGLVAAMNPTFDRINQVSGAVVEMRDEMVTTLAAMRNAHQSIMDAIARMEAEQDHWQRAATARIKRALPDVH